MVFSEDFIMELKERNNIEEIISEYVSINRRGKNLLGLCPFHAERTPSFCVYPNNGSFYCFGCGVGGDVITFLRLAEHFDYVEAVKYLAERVGMNTQISDEDNEIYRQKALIYKANREAAKYFHNCLMSDKGSEAINYLKERHILPKTVKHFGLGYSPSSGYALIDYLKAQGYSEDVIISANLGMKSGNSKCRDRFKGRLMFPIIDVRGNVVAFGARTLKSETPKYINTADTPVFKKSSNLFALNFAKNSGREKLILTEGYMDAVSLHQAGFSNTVAGLGTALTLGQVKLLGRYCDEVVLSYDADEAGQKAAKKAMEMLRENGMSVKILSIPKAKDPDEYIRSNGKDGVIKFKDLVDKSKSDMEFKLESIKSNLDLETAEGKVKYLTAAAKELANCENAIERDIYISKLCEETGINRSSIVLQVEKYMKMKSGRARKQEFKNISKFTSGINDKINKEKRNNLRAACAEESLLSCIINNPDIANNIFSRIDEEVFITDLNRRIYAAAKRLSSEDKVMDINSFSSGGEFSLEEIGRITKIICSYKPNMITDESIDEYLNILMDEKRKNDIKNEETTEFEIKKYIEELRESKK